MYKIKGIDMVLSKDNFKGAWLLSVGNSGISLDDFIEALIESGVVQRVEPEKTGNLIKFPVDISNKV